MFLSGDRTYIREKRVDFVQGILAETTVLFSRGFHYLNFLLCQNAHQLQVTLKVYKAY